ncbi:histidine phosphatase family protein [Saccharothrix variisporea]|uniref:2,3-bisphosphoglycerate-dependent phosphoglycerate mutase n=1 Tax=Saccharothrix variisporea TaxID=543527 RepID=A0A495X159_9PSEU|nr:histidine phosphatase family protein [Saccharothrix variisporea]RKT67005.1 2,3-bisphosphoglycerate-dependent phosphoglycerate mutase [Saccharothrix variisporea]
MRAELILVRHARPLLPAPGGPDDHHRPLTEEGLAQAERLVDDLAGLRPTAIASSPYLRAVQTVEPTARALGLPVHRDHDLREWDSAIGSTPDYARHYAESWADPHHTRPGAESLHQLSVRATTALTALAEHHQDGTVVIGSHGTFISRALVGFGVTTVDWPFSHAMPMPALYRLRFTARGVEITGPGL